MKLSDKFTLDTIYLQKLKYRIVDQKVEMENKHESTEPKPLRSEIKNFKNGQLYLVLVQDEKRNKFLPFENL